MTVKEKRDYINVMTKKYKITLEEILDTFDKCEICDMYDAVEFIVYQHELNKLSDDCFKYINTDSIKESDTDESKKN